MGGSVEGGRKGEREGVLIQDISTASSSRTQRARRRGGAGAVRKLATFLTLFFPTPCVKEGYVQPFGR